MVERRMEQHVWGFIASNAWGAPQTGHQGATWLELFTRYLMTGGIIQATQTNDPTTRLKRITPKQALERFSKAVKRIVNTCLLPADRYLFRPAKTGERRLKRLAISSHLAAVCTIPCWAQGTAAEVADAILAAGRGWTKEKNDKRIQGSMRLRPSKYSLSSLPGDRSRGGDMGWSETFRLQQREQHHDQPRHTEDMGKPDSVIITCPTCNNPREAQGSITLLNGTAFRLLVCPCCKKAKQSSQWRCSCGVPWHICTIHLEPGRACRAKPRCPRGQLAKRKARIAKRNTIDTDQGTAATQNGDEAMEGVTGDHDMDSGATGLGDLPAQNGHSHTVAADPDHRLTQKAARKAEKHSKREAKRRKAEGGGSTHTFQVISDDECEAEQH
jgi:hypothetical protein